MTGKRVVLIGSRVLAQKDVSRAFASDRFRASVAQRAQIDAVQEMLPGSKQDGAHDQMQLVDQAGTQILPNGGNAATHADVTPARSGACLLEGGMNTFCDEPNLRTSDHLERRSGMIDDHEDRHMIRRLLAPPSLPTVIRPGAADRTEHVPPENPGSDSGEAELRHLVIDTCLAVGLSVHPPPCPRVKE